MTPEFLIAAAICLPLIIAAGIAAFGKFPNLREGVTIAGSIALFAIVVQLTLLVGVDRRELCLMGVEGAHAELSERRAHIGSTLRAWEGWPVHVQWHRDASLIM
jgi:hypothetical protein